MLCRREAALENFVWVQGPDEYFDCTRFLCLASESKRVLSMLPGCVTLPYRSLAFPDTQMPSVPSRSALPDAKREPVHRPSAWGAVPMRAGSIDPRQWRYFCKAPLQFKVERFFDWFHGLRGRSFPPQTLQDLKERFPADWEGVP